MIKLYRCLFLLASFISFSQNFIEGKVSYNDEFGVNQSLIGVLNPYSNKDKLDNLVNYIYLFCSS